MLIEYPNTSAYAIFNDNSFTDLNIEVRARSIFIAGYYNGEIMPGRGSYLEFILIINSGILQLFFSKPNSL